LEREYVNCYTAAEEIEQVKEKPSAIDKCRKIKKNIIVYA
jgi:hypothetical protein